MAKGKGFTRFSAGQAVTGIAIVSLMSLYLAADAHAMGKKPEQPKEAPSAAMPGPDSQEVEIITPEKPSRPEVDIAKPSAATTEPALNDVSESQAALASPDNSVHIKDIQTALKNAGFDPGPVDGTMGRKTKKAVRDFQAAGGLKVDGKVGPKTWAAMAKYLATSAATETQ